MARRRPGKHAAEPPRTWRFLLLLLIAALPARAAPLALLPPASRVELRAYGLGLIPFDGQFTRFHGWMRTDSANPNVCQVVLEIDAASLAMSETSVRDGITGPEFMDVAQFPDLAFHGSCEGDRVTGSLLLHGQNHPFTLDIESSPSAGTLVFSGQLKRAEWGMTARRFTAGSTVRIRVAFPNPANGPHT
nr:YceI family protein [uncultured Rhodopila sp.]